MLIVSFISIMIINKCDEGGFVWRLINKFICVLFYDC